MTQKLDQTYLFYGLGRTIYLTIIFVALTKSALLLLALSVNSSEFQSPELITALPVPTWINFTVMFLMDCLRYIIFGVVIYGLLVGLGRLATFKFSLNPKNHMVTYWVLGFAILTPMLVYLIQSPIESPQQAGLLAKWTIFPLLYYYIFGYFIWNWIWENLLEPMTDVDNDEPSFFQAP